MKTTRTFRTKDGRRWRWSMTGWQAVTILTAQLGAGFIILAAAFILAGSMSPSGV